MPAIKSQHARMLEQLVAERRQALLESLALGHEQNAYLILAGKVQGLDETLLLSEQADFKLNGGEDTDASS